ncbi:MAG: class II fructose-1,6-bisphosphate aldolase [Bacilli bacterium]|nr:class II fructose-1,6-bisphosphate aldolase [Bacilli bacterium]MDD4643676.1 class II fructose-1,6-bisphosphate aldolase [Bacilli bacterium]
MLVNTRNMLRKAKEEGYAVPQFNINNLEWTKYILEVCEECKSPLILGVSEGAVKYMGGYKTVYSVVIGVMSDLNITIPVALHLDHGKSIDYCKKAIENGFTSVMIDSSSYPLDENIRITKDVVAYAHSKGVTVEAEVGHIGGIEDDINGDNVYAKVGDCIKLVTETGVDSLAPAVGSVHGLYEGEAKIDLERIRLISEAVKIPLVLHGGTGIPDQTIIDCIQVGISKINVNTELQVAWAKEIRLFLNNNQSVYDPRKIIGSGSDAIKKVVRDKIILFKSHNKA